MPLLCTVAHLGLPVQDQPTGRTIPCALRAQADMRFDEPDSRSLGKMTGDRDGWVARDEHTLRPPWNLPTSGVPPRNLSPLIRVFWFSCDTLSHCPTAARTL
jgi:hypothetical protein